MRKSCDNVHLASRIYERLLCVYPRGHRREYGPLMAQLFRDQCREASRVGSRYALLALSLRTLSDLVFAAFREHLTEQSNHMKNLPPQTISLLLFIAAVSAGILSCNFIVAQPGIALGLAYLSAILLLPRAVAEWKRPEDQLVRSLTWGASIAVIFALIFPVWGKLKLPIIPLLVAAPILLNAIVPMIKVALRLTRPRC